MSDRVVVIGAGPAGLTAAYALAQRGRPAVVLEADTVVGGISRTVRHHGYHFDLGGHRFFTRFTEVEHLWREVLGDDLLVRPRLSRIYFRGKFFDYPLKASNALLNLGFLEAARCTLSYGAAKLKPTGDDASFEGWVSNRFGRRLFENFFKTYTEKVWGIPCSQIEAEWAAQRIKNLSLGSAIRNALFPQKSGAVVSLIEEFLYPRRGPGMMYERMADRIRELGGEVRLGARVVGLARSGGRIVAARVASKDGGESRVEGAEFISSAPLTEVVQRFTPGATDRVLEAARSLKYRHLLTVNVIVDRANLFPDNWIYIHSPELRMGRVQNFGNWSPEMVPEPNTSGLGVEYFVSDGDPLWNMPDDQLVSFAARELTSAGLLKGAHVTDGIVVRVPGAYPVYRSGYRAALDTVVEFVRGIDNLQVVGRYGMFKYNNMDHSMLTALLAVENLGGAKHDLWSVNTDSAYHEVRSESAFGRNPRRVARGT